MRPRGRWQLLSCNMLQYFHDCSQDNFWISIKVRSFATQMSHFLLDTFETDFMRVGHVSWLILVQPFWPQFGVTFVQVFETFEASQHSQNLWSDLETYMAGSWPSQRVPRLQLWSCLCLDSCMVCFSLATTWGDPNQATTTPSQIDGAATAATSGVRQLKPALGGQKKLLSADCESFRWCSLLSAKLFFLIL